MRKAEKPKGVSNSEAYESYKRDTRRQEQKSWNAPIPSCHLSQILRIDRDRATVCQRWCDSIVGGQGGGPVESLVIQAFPQLPSNLFFPSRGIHCGHDAPPPTPARNRRGTLNDPEPGQALAVPPVAIQEHQAGILDFPVRATGLIASQQVEIVLKKLASKGIQILQSFGGLGGEPMIDFLGRPSWIAIARSQWEVSFGVGLPLAPMRKRELRGGCAGPIAVEQPREAVRQGGEVGVENESGCEPGQEDSLTQQDITLFERSLGGIEESVGQGKHVLGIFLFTISHVEWRPAPQTPAGSG